MSKIYNIEELRREFLLKKSNEDKAEYMQRQQELIEKLIKENTQMQERLSHLESNLMVSASPLLIGNDNAEELICVEQIKILKDRSQSKELDINDVKKLDLLIKNLRLIRSQPTGNVNANYRDVSEADLVAIALGTKED